MKITLDSCVIIDYLSSNRTFHGDALKLFSLNSIILYTTETVLGEITDTHQKNTLNDLVLNQKIQILPQPQMGVVYPAIVPMQYTYISPERELSINKLLSTNKGLHKDKILKDFLIAEAHKLSGNDFLMTSNIKHFCTNLDISIISYKELSSLLKRI